MLLTELASKQQRWLAFCCQPRIYCVLLSFSHNPRRADWTVINCLDRERLGLRGLTPKSNQVVIGQVVASVIGTINCLYRSQLSSIYFSLCHRQANVPPGEIWLRGSHQQVCLALVEMRWREGLWERGRWGGLRCWWVCFVIYSHWFIRQARDGKSRALYISVKWTTIVFEFKALIVTVLNRKRGRRRAINQIQTQKELREQRHSPRFCGVVGATDGGSIRV